MTELQQTVMNYENTGNVLNAIYADMPAAVTKCTALSR